MYELSSRSQVPVTWRARVRFLIVALAALLFTSAASAATFQVNSTGDRSDSTLGDGFCWTGIFVSRPGGLVAECTLRAAIQQANSTAGFDIIEFDSNLPVDSVGTSIIFLESPLPAIGAPVRIDGRSAPGYAAGTPFANPVVVLTGFIIPQAGADGLVLSENADQSEILALAIMSFAGDGIDLSGADSVLLDGLHIGVWRGEFTLGNLGHGIHVRSNSTSTRIGTEFNVFGGYNGIGNLISANDGDGIRVFGDGTRISGNHIGVDKTGTAVLVPVVGNLGNHGFGVQLASGADNVQIGQVGSALGGRVASGNVIAGNTLGGIEIGETLGVTIHGNFIGVDVTGTNALGNGSSYGLRILGDGVVVGEENVGRNVISGHQTHGVVLGRVGASIWIAEDNQILGNRIGLNAAGDAVIPNASHGILVDRGIDNLIEGNWIGGNLSNGIFLQQLATSNDVRRNYVGTNPSGDDLGNGGIGISVLGDLNMIGGYGAGNVVGLCAFGIDLASLAEQNAVLGNFVGTDEIGRNLANRVSGLNVSGNNNTIGSDFPGYENTIGWNGGSGIYFQGDAFGNSVLGNYIGTNAAGMELGNVFSGISLTGSSTANTIGSSYGSIGIFPGATNEIAYNLAGVQVSSSAVDNPIRGNSIRDNEFGGIILVSSGGALNDFGDADTGPNQLQNYPEFDLENTQLNQVTGELEVEYRVTSSTSHSAYPLKIDFYLADADFEEPEVYLGTSIYSAQNAFLLRPATISANDPFLPSDRIVATATDANGNTSMVSFPIHVPEPTVSLALGAGCVLLACAGTRRRSHDPVRGDRDL